MLQQAMSKFAGTSLFREKYDNFIGGRWVAPVRGQYFDNISPITGKPVCQVARGTAEDIELALDAAHKAKDAWGRASTTERSTAGRSSSVTQRATASRSRSSVSGLVT